MKRLIHVKANTHDTSFIWVLSLVMDENYTSNHDFLKTSSSIVQPFALGGKGWPELHFIVHQDPLCWPFDMSISFSLLQALELLLHNDMLSKPQL